MTIYRDQTITRIFSLLTGVIFLNMSFFLVEISLLDIKDPRMIENVCNLVLNGGLEEERDVHSTGGEVPVSVFSAASELSLRHSSVFLIASKIHRDSEDNYLHADHSEIFSPPPEFRQGYSKTS